MSTIKCNTSDLPSLNIFKRAGIILYYTINDVNYFIFGVDSKYGTLTDFGGGVDPGENCIQAGLRELYEESAGLFNYMNKADYIRNNSICIYNGASIIIFQKISITQEEIIDICLQYKEIYIDQASANCYLENSFIVWISEPNLYQLCSGSSVVMPNELSELFVLNSSVKIYSRKNKSIQRKFSRGLTIYTPLYQPIKNLLSEIFSKSTLFDKKFVYTKYSPYVYEPLKEETHESP